MRYRWTATPARVVFTRRSNRWTFVLFLLVGFTCSSIGGWATLGGATVSAFVAIFMQMLLAIGLLFVVVALKGIQVGDSYDPYEIVFDGARGIIRVRDAGSAGAVIEIPFADVRGFEVREQRIQNSSQAAGRIQASSCNYFAIVRTASATFDVVQADSRAEPERAVAAMTGCVAGARGLPGASDVSGTDTLPGKLTATNDGSTTTLRWRNAAVGSMVFFLFVVAGIGFVMSRFANIFMLEKGFPGIKYPVAGFLILILLFIVFVNMRKFVRDLRSTYELAMSPAGLRYAEYPASANGAPPRTVIALAPMEIGRISFEHQIGEQPRPFRVCAPDLGETERLTFDVATLSATERMMLAAWIRKRSCV